MNGCRAERIFPTTNRIKRYRRPFAGWERTDREKEWKAAKEIISCINLPHGNKKV
jgi:hypothetical protein